MNSRVMPRLTFICPSFQSYLPAVHRYGVNKSCDELNLDAILMAAHTCHRCLPEPCRNGGKCVGTQGRGFTCECADGFGGDLCEDVVSLAARVPGGAGAATMSSAVQQRPSLGLGLATLAALGVAAATLVGGGPSFCDPASTRWDEGTHQCVATREGLVGACKEARGRGWGWTCEGAVQVPAC